MTRSGIERNLKTTPYKSLQHYADGRTACFNFSSNLGLCKFENASLAFNVSVNDSLTNRFKVRFNLCKLITDLILYSKTESRGFLVVLDRGEVITCLEEVELNGARPEKLN